MTWPGVVVVLLAILVWHYVGYPALLQAVVAVSDRPIPPAEPAEWPPVSIIIIAHNEADVIEDRIENIRSVDYPQERIEIVVASDASTDETIPLARAAAPNVTVVDNRDQNKSRTRNMGVERATHKILLFTDADTRYQSDCVKQLVRHYESPAVGGVCGSLVSESFDEGAVGQGMGIYWKWEYFLRRLQGRLGLLVKYSGANMSMRRSFYQDVADDVDIDQMAGLDVISQGGQSVFEPDAIAKERFPTSLEGELSTRRRLTIRALTALNRHRHALNPFVNPKLAVHVWSYWLLRYCVPVLVAGTTLATALAARGSVLFGVFLAVQVVCYMLVGAGYLLEQRSSDLSLVLIPFSYFWANVGILIGTVAFLSGKRVYAYSDQH